MARIEQEDDLWVVYDDDGGFTEFSNEQDAQDFLEDLE